MGRLVEFSASGLQEAGFQEPVGFKTIGRNDVLGYRGAPDVEGIYIVLQAPSELPIFIPADHPRHAGATRTECLAKRWVAAASVLYIGKAPLRAPRKANGKRTGLWQRINEYQGFVYRAGTNHSGGEDLRRLPERDSLTVTWRPTGNPGVVERGLIAEFTRRYSARPFANRDDGDGPLISPRCC
jgi:hypothetical protein